jgi:riboflavin kinase/FMN adenylyltransferase
MTLEQKLAAFDRAGMQGVVIISFTMELAQWSPEQFVEMVIIDWLRVAEVWVGANFLFGKDRAGTFTLLRAIGDDRGFRVDKIDPVRYKEFVVSSTRIRRLVEEGRVDEAAALLGHHYTIDGRVVTGDKRGRELGMPTANLETANELLPLNGIYATVAIVDDVAHPAVTSVGVRPTIGDGKFTVETHLLDGAMDLYGQQVSVAFVRWIRAEARFEGPDAMTALAAAMASDAATARALFAHLGV